MGNGDFLNLIRTDWHSKCSNSRNDELPEEKKKDRWNANKSVRDFFVFSEFSQLFPVRVDKVSGYVSRSRKCDLMYPVVNNYDHMCELGEEVFYIESPFLLPPKS